MRKFIAVLAFAAVTVVAPSARGGLLDFHAFGTFQDSTDIIGSPQDVSPFRSSFYGNVTVDTTTGKVTAVDLTMQTSYLDAGAGQDQSLNFRVNSPSVFLPSNAGFEFNPQTVPHYPPDSPVVVSETEIIGGLHFSYPFWRSTFSNPSFSLVIEGSLVDYPENGGPLAGLPLFYHTSWSGRGHTFALTSGELFPPSWLEKLFVALRVITPFLLITPDDVLPLLAEGNPDALAAFDEVRNQELNPVPEPSTMVLALILFATAITAHAVRSRLRCGVVAA